MGCVEGTSLNFWSGYDGNTDFTKCLLSLYYNGKLFCINELRSGNQTTLLFQIQEIYQTTVKCSPLQCTILVCIIQPANQHLSKFCANAFISTYTGSFQSQVMGHCWYPGKCYTTCAPLCCTNWLKMLKSCILFCCIRIDIISCPSNIWGKIPEIFQVRKVNVCLCSQGFLQSCFFLYMFHDWLCKM